MIYPIFSSIAHQAHVLKPKGVCLVILEVPIEDFCTIFTGTVKCDPLTPCSQVSHSKMI